MILRQTYNPSVEQIAEEFQITFEEASELSKDSNSHDVIIGDSQIFLTTNADDPGDAKTLIVDSITKLSKNQGR